MKTAGKQKHLACGVVGWLSFTSEDFYGHQSGLLPLQSAPMNDQIIGNSPNISAASVATRRALSRSFQ